MFYTDVLVIARERKPLNYVRALRSVEDHCVDLQNYWASSLLHKQSIKEQLWANFCILCILLQHVTILFTDSAIQKNRKKLKKQRE